jgi:hypothetical protein
MPSLTRIGAANEAGIARILCLMCKRPIGKYQEMKGKAVCTGCEPLLRPKTKRLMWE